MVGPELTLLVCANGTFCNFKGDAGAVDDLVQQSIGAAVDIAARDHMITRLEQQHRTVGRHHAAGISERSGSPFQRSDLTSQKK